MVTSIVSPTSAVRQTPYITPDMFRVHARAGVQVENLVVKGQPADQEAALLNYIRSASSWMDEHAEQIFAATQDTVVQQVNVDSNGFVEIHPRYVPVIGLTAFAIGSLPSNMASVSSLSGAVVTQDGIHVPVYPLAALTSSEGPIQFGGVNSPWDQAWCQYTYVNGYPVTTLTADVAASATSIPVLDTTGIVQGKTWLTMYSGKTQYRFLAGAVSTADAGGLGTGPGTVGCAAVPAAINNPGIPVMVSALPDSLIEACVLVTRALIKQKGGGAVAASSATSREPKKGRNNAGDDFAEAWDIIQRAMQVAVTT